MNLALILGRAGRSGQSIPDKNLLPVLGRPLVEYPIRAALAAARIDLVAVSTNCAKIKAVARDKGVRVIDRPEEYCQPDSTFTEALIHALEILGRPVEYLAVLPANCATYPPGLIDRCIERLDADAGAESCVTGRREVRAHPYWSKQIDQKGYLVPWFPEIDSRRYENRQGLPPCFVLDHSVYVIRLHGQDLAAGQPPFPYLGQKIVFLENDTEAFDLNGPEEIGKMEQWLSDHGHRSMS